MYSRPSSRSKRRFLSGHGRADSHTTATSEPLPGVNVERNRARRVTWGHEQARRFDRSEVTNRFSVGIAVAAMLLALMATFGTLNPLERASLAAEADTPAMEQVETPVVPSSLTNA